MKKLAPADPASTGESQNINLRSLLPSPMHLTTKLYHRSERGNYKAENSQSLLFRGDTSYIHEKILNIRI